MPALQRFRTALPFAALSLLTLLLVGCGPNLIDRVTGPVGGICGLIIVILDIVALVGLWQSGRSTGDKVLWTLLIVFFPVGGLILYYIFA
jgi:hypothetical protein